jgi:hypothetical protein
MKTNWIRIFALSAMATAATWAQPAEPAHAHASGSAAGVSITGVWDVAVTVVDCQTGAVVRNIRSLQIYQADGTFSDTTSSGARGGGVGTWRQEGRVNSPHKPPLGASLLYRRRSFVAGPFPRDYSHQSRRRPRPPR